MDGVLVETSEAHYRSWLVAAGHFGFPFNREIFLRYYGMNNASILRALLGEAVSADLITEIGAYKENCFREDMKDSIELLPGVADMAGTFPESRLPAGGRLFGSAGEYRLLGGCHRDPQVFHRPGLLFGWTDQTGPLGFPGSRPAVERPTG